MGAPDPGRWRMVPPPAGQADPVADALDLLDDLIDWSDPEHHQSKDRQALTLVREALGRPRPG